LTRGAAVDRRSGGQPAGQHQVEHRRRARLPLAAPDAAGDDAGSAAATLAAVAAAPRFGTALAALARFDLAYTMVTLGGITLRQEVTPPALQSRVNTTGRMLAWGTFPAGAALGGGLAEVLPVRVTLLVLAAPVVGTVLLGLRSPEMRHRARRGHVTMRHDFQR
jgi:hypothetical protein